jgi:hypothetical protein
MVLDRLEETSGARADERAMGGVGGLGGTLMGIGTFEIRADGLME